MVAGGASFNRVRGEHKAPHPRKALSQNRTRKGCQIKALRWMHLPGLRRQSCDDRLNSRSTPLLALTPPSGCGVWGATLSAGARSASASDLLRLAPPATIYDTFGVSPPVLAPLRSVTLRWGRQ